jgi:hypothetical protein
MSEEFQAIVIEPAYRKVADARTSCWIPVPYLASSFSSLERAR